MRGLMQNAKFSLNPFPSHTKITSPSNGILIFFLCHKRTNQRFFCFPNGSTKRPLTTKQQKFIIPLHSTTCNGLETLIIKYNTVIIYTIMIVVLSSFIFLLFLCEKFYTESTQYLPISQCFYLFRL